MKKTISLILTIFALCIFAGCESGGTEVLPTSETETQGGASAAPVPDSGSGGTDAKALVVYFSWSGNTKAVAEAIQSQTGSELFEIVPQTPYSDDYNTLLDDAQEEQSTDARPAISGTIENLEQYDVIFVGYPNWWGDMPMILYTFFDSYDLSGKTIAPFCTSGGSGLSGTVNTIKALEPNATVTDGLHIGSSAASNPDGAVSSWLSEIGLAETGG
ncbi:MAG TPA: flavodoxin [Clostridiales bacterium]|uniref:NAD(P)H-dependent oxidoreductase n=1 Tax=Candidatus Egerieisoma faecipullorum TaxID=2840963 RepID=A0A9D1I825_9CLOT|nr:flavodoxin [Clostridiales bacterium]HIU30136.1 NAD(P)H-dependent oxidoreductase [Candidatus Egerieisoma faecipullorum]